MPKFKHGTHINKIRKRKNRTLQKYLRISAGPQRGKYVHRMLVEARIGRPLCDWEEIDHKDGNALNNEPSNLSDPITDAEHTRLENARRKAKRDAATKSKVQVEVKEIPRTGTDFNFGANNDSTE